jgi:uncharacterized membrane protein YkvA (DUF1232 family)
MGEKISGKKIEQSSFFRRARKLAAEYVRNPARLNGLLDRAAQKFNRRQGPFSEIRDSLQACYRLLRAWSGGRYRQIPTASLISIIASVIYFVMPIDVIPDFILALGLVDDAALLSWIMSAVKSDIDRFLAWEREHGEAGMPETLEDDSDDGD